MKLSLLLKRLNDVVTKYGDDIDIEEVDCTPTHEILVFTDDGHTLTESLVSDILVNEFKGFKSLREIKELKNG